MELGDLKDKKIAILGIGLENIFLGDFLIKNGIKNVELRDQKDLLEIGEGLEDETKEVLNKLLSVQPKHLFGKDYLSGLKNFDVIFRTPGLPYLTSEIQEAVKSGVTVSSQIKLFFDLCPAKIIGVTGTKGKGTTAKLIESILLSSQESKIFLLGNIGKAAINNLDQISKDDLVILELSSFQLQDLEKSPHIAVITNLDSDHLNYHKDLEEYWGAKANILKYQTKNDFAIINQDYLSTFELVSQTEGKVYYFSGKNSVDEGAYVRNIKNQISNTKKREVVLKTDSKEKVVCRSDELNIVGEHNLENIAAAAIVGQIIGANFVDIHKAILNFKGLEHRLEFVAEKRGIKYFNDSFATNPVATIAAIHSFNEPLVLILGGSEKKLGYKNLIEEIIKRENIKVICIGETGERITSELKLAGYDNIISAGTTMAEIVNSAEQVAESGDVILLSPASASFGLFKDYKDRGNQFKQAVAKIKY